MADTFSSVLAQALQLPLGDRSRMATLLIERIESIEKGTAILVPHEEVMKNVRQKLAKQRAERSA